MDNYARIKGGIAVDVSHDPSTQFHPTVAAEFESVPSEVKRGWRLSDGDWLPPVTSPDPDQGNYKPLELNPVQFMLLFTSSERVAIKAARANDQVVADFFDLLEDPRLEQVRLGQPAVQEGVYYLAAQSLITEQRRDEILQGGTQ